MKKAWILALAGSLVACGQPAGKPAGDDLSVPEVAEHDDALLAEVPESEPLASPYEVAESAPDDRDFAALAAYPDTWHVSYGWPGEYPAGFVVLEQGVTVNGRARPNPDAPANVACTLPQYANYQIWNRQRVERDHLEFIVASKIEPVVMKVDANIETPGDEGMRVLNLKAGDVLSYLRYLGEGFAIFSFDGQEYTINEAELRDISSMTGASWRKTSGWRSPVSAARAPGSSMTTPSPMTRSCRPPSSASAKQRHLSRRSGQGARRRARTGNLPARPVRWRLGRLGPHCLNRPGTCS